MSDPRAGERAQEPQPQLRVALLEGEAAQREAEARHHRVVRGADDARRARPALTQHTRTDPGQSHARAGSGGAAANALLLVCALGRVGVGPGTCFSYVYFGGLYERA